MTARRTVLALAATALLAACATQPTQTSTTPAAAATPATASAAERHRLLLISIDGLRADMLDRGITPNLARITRDGVRARWMTPSYPSLTFPNHYTIVTGLRPDHHGIVHNSMHEDDLGSFKLHLRDAVTDPRWWGGEPIWVGAENAGIRTATWSWPGSEAAINGVRPSISNPYDESVPLDARVDLVLDWVDMRGAAQPQLMTLYMENVDKAGHNHGPDSPEYKDAIARSDAAVGRLLDGIDARGLAGELDIILVSDHGMASVPDGNVIASESMVDPAVAENVSIGQSIGFNPRPGREAEAERQLLGAHAQYDCWRREQLPERWHYGSHPRIPAIICQMHEGWDALDAPAMAKRKAGDRGSHGFDTALPSMRAVFIARGPSFKIGQTIEPIDNVDVYPLLTRLLGVPAAKHDGDADALVPALRATAR